MFFLLCLLMIQINVLFYHKPQVLKPEFHYRLNFKFINWNYLHDCQHEVK